MILRNWTQIDAPGDNTLLAMVHEIFFREAYNHANLPIETHDIVVDIGANIGVFALFAASRTKNTVYAFQPFFVSVNCASRNINRNGFHNIVTYEVAVSGRMGSATLCLSEIGGGHLLFDHNIERQ